MEATEYDRMDAVEQSMWWYRGLHRRVEAALAAALPAAGRVLDAGCGTGGLLARLGRRFPGYAFFGVEFDPKAGGRASAKSGAPVATGSVNALPFPDGAFDAMVSLDVLCHRAVDEAQALDSLHRCLKPGGVLILNLPAFAWLLSEHDRIVHNARRYDRRGLRELLDRHGFRPLSLRYWNSLLFPLMVLRRKVFPHDRASDVGEFPKAVDRILYAMLVLENGLSRLGLRFPFGGSLMAIAVKPHA